MAIIQKGMPEKHPFFFPLRIPSIRDPDLFLHNKTTLVKTALVTHPVREYIGAAFGAGLEIRHAKSMMRTSHP